MSTERIRASLAALVRVWLEPTRYHGFYPYRVVTLELGGYANLQAIEAAHGMPDLRRVKALPGAAGASSTPALGSKVLVGFEAGSSARPFIAFYTAEGEPGHVPTTATLDGSTSVKLGAAVGPVVRYGDNVQVGSEAGIITWLPGGHTPTSRVLA